ncbi:MAG: hypothetical protein IJ662_04235 [Clostridia bacterium]|nr:hypothetical protein [Clostridia bacterium]
MGKAMDKLNHLRQERNELMNRNDRLYKQYGYLMDDVGREWNKADYEIKLSVLDRKIQLAETAARQEYERETADALLRDINNEATQAGKEFAQAFT